jgi:hypothetical protein
VAQISPSDAALEGFEVLRQSWRAVLGWAGFQIVAVIALIALLLVALLATVPFATDRDTAGAIGGILGALLLGLGGLGVQMVILGGLFRLMLRPETPAFMHLRLSLDELRVAAGVVILGLAMIAVLFAAIALAGWAGSVSGWLGAAAWIGVAFAGYLLILRLGVTPVIAFAERRIDPLESCRRTRGQTWRLLGMGLLVLCLTGLLAVVALLTVFLLQGLLTGFSDLDLSGTETLTEHPGRWFFQVAAELVLAPVFLVIGNAPWVAVYRAVSEPTEAA